MDQLIQTMPTKEQIRTFPYFQNLSIENILLIKTLQQCDAIENELKIAPILGFDSESKPTFNKTDIQTGPHLVQLATFEKAYLFQVSDEILNFLKPIFESHDQIKVGFGLKNDAHLFRKKGIELNNIIELSKCFSRFGFSNPVGIKNAMALLFKVNFPKSKTISTSNWARKNLTQAQMQYAAADAYAPVLIFDELRHLDLLPESVAKTVLKLKTHSNKS